MSELNVLMQCSDYYAPFCGVALQSLFLNNREIDKIKVFLIVDKVSEENIVKFKELAHNFDREIAFINGDLINNKIASTGIKKYHNSYTTYYKLFVSDFIKSPIKQLLYLDSDILVIGSLRELVNYNMQGKTLGMVQDFTGVVHKKMIGFLDKIFYNAGVILFDFEKWKKEVCEEKIIKHLTKIRGNYALADQDIVNIVMENEITSLDLKFNINTDFLIYKSKDLAKKSYNVNYPFYENTFYDALKYPVVYHCARALTAAPWSQSSNHPVAKQWDYYLRQSPWKNYKKEKEVLSFAFKVQRIMFSAFPQEVFAYVNRTSVSLFQFCRNLKAKYYSKG